MRQKIEEKNLKFLFAVKIHVDGGCWTFQNWLKIFFITRGNHVEHSFNASAFCQSSRLG